jgi:hypothetical protein
MHIRKKKNLSAVPIQCIDDDENLIDHQFFFTFRDDAWDIEQTLLEHFGKHRAFGRLLRS